MSSRPDELPQAADAADPHAAIDALRARGGAQRDPLRFHFIETLAKRAASQQGQARQLLDRRLLQLLAEFDLAHADSPGAAASVPQQQAAATAARGPLAELVEHLALQSPPADADALASASAAPERAAATAAHGAAGPDTAPDAPAELKTMRYFRGTWSRLSAERRLTQSLAKMPENAGPLNSHHLVHRSLILMRDLSPEYLNRFMTYVDTLLSLEELQAAGAPTPAARSEGGRKPGRGKSA